MTVSKALIYTLISAFSWAISIVAARFILRSGASGLNLILWTSLLSLPYWIYVAGKQKNEIKKISKKGALIIICIAVINAAVANIIEMYAIKYSTAVNYSFLIRTVLVFTVVFAYLFLGEKITAKKILLVVLILTGSYLLCTKGKIISLSIGDMLTLAEAACISFGGTILGKISLQLMNRHVSSSLSCILGTVIIFLVALGSGHITWPQIPVLTLILSLSNVILMHFKFKAYESAAASYIAMIFSLTPVFVYIMSIFLLNETLSPIQLAGGTLIVSAAIAAEKIKKLN